MVDTNWGLVADDRINDNLDFSKIHSKADYERELKKYLRTTTDKSGRKVGMNILNAVKKSPDSIFDEMYEDSNAKEKVDEQIELLEKAQRFQKRRGRRGRRDALITAKDTRRVAKKTLRRWKKRPETFDIRGIDTKKLVKEPRKHVITGRDIKLRSKGVSVSLNVRGIKQARSIKTGKYVSVKGLL